MTHSLKSNHIPGPYIYVRGSDGVDDTWDIQSVATRAHIASAHFWDCDSDSLAQAEATARLLAAAPELLSSLRVLLKALKREDRPFGRTGTKAILASTKLIERIEAGS